MNPEIREMCRVRSALTEIRTDKEDGWQLEEVVAIKYFMEDGRLFEKKSHDIKIHGRGGISIATRNGNRREVRAAVDSPPFIDRKLPIAPPRKHGSTARSCTDRVKK
ncbi:hypothetical protein OIDMADRAFT_49432 [Oidiodendron maius Zn]|uniref:Uncharacterized protein n=1 Tax=Oidiodendron maius (strain Zn) TaxID=913774 RepID=A0A0C3D3T1_OIDMZ|nr:hypothetical protein OIDMADRAFT_49432 [Oidiodendron maius Zn]